MRVVATVGIVAMGLIWTVWLSLAVWLGRMRDEPRPVAITVRKWVVIGSATALLFAGSWWLVGLLHMAL